MQIQAVLLRVVITEQMPDSFRDWKKRVPQNGSETACSPTPLNQIAGISVVEGRTLVIKPYDPSSLRDIEKACNQADLGIAPQNDGSVIRLTVPKLTGDTRKEMTKKVSKLAEEAKVQIRNIRRDAMTAVKKDETMDEDTQKDAEKEVQKLTDKYVKKIDQIADAKNKEVLTV